MGVRIKLDIESLRFINLFQSITKATVKDCIVDDDKVLFVVKDGQAGMAIGREGVNIKNIQRLIKRRVEVVEFSDDLKRFINNLLRPIRVVDLMPVNRSDGKHVFRITVEGDGNVNPKVYVKGKIKKVRSLLKKYFSVDDVTIG